MTPVAPILDGVWITSGQKKPRTLYWPEEPVDRHAAIRLVQGGPSDISLTHDFPAGWEGEAAGA